MFLNFFQIWFGALLINKSYFALQFSIRLCQDEPRNKLSAKLACNMGTQLKVDKLIFGHSKRLTLTLTMRAVTKRPPSKKKTFDFLAVVLVQYLR